MHTNDVIMADQPQEREGLEGCTELDLLRGNQWRKGTFKNWKAKLLHNFCVEFLQCHSLLSLCSHPSNIRHGESRFVVTKHRFIWLR